jgi:hypothetical protein
MPTSNAPVPIERIEHAIFLIRGEKVMLDSDLAALYGVSTKRLNEQVKRNLRRFPKDFMFRLTTVEVRELRSQFATSNSRRGGRRARPYAFTEHGAIMLASVLNSEVAVQDAVTAATSSGFHLTLSFGTLAPVQRGAVPGSPTPRQGRSRWCADL